MVTMSDFHTLPCTSTGISQPPRGFRALAVSLLVWPLLILHQRPGWAEDVAGPGREPSMNLKVEYNPVRNNIAILCDLLDDPNRDAAKSLIVELYDPEMDEVLVEERITRRENDRFEGLVRVPPLKHRNYLLKARLTNRDTPGKKEDASQPPEQILAAQEKTIERLNEAKRFSWWNNPLGNWDAPVPPHTEMRYQDTVILTTTGRVEFGGNGLIRQIHRGGEDLLAAPMRIAASVAGKYLSWTLRDKPGFLKRTPVEAKLHGEMTSQHLEVSALTHVEYDGMARIELFIRPKGKPKVHRLALEIPFRPEHAPLLWTMANDCRSSWKAVLFEPREGLLWDSRSCAAGQSRAAGSFMPQYVVGDSFRGLCWFADNDQGWVPDDDVPATEVERRGKELILRYNFIGKPFEFASPRKIVFGLLGLPARPFVPEWRLVRRHLEESFGPYSSDKEMWCYSPPFPKDWDQARERIEKHYDGIQNFFIPWHDSHSWPTIPGNDEKVFSYLQQECGDGMWTRTLIDYKCHLWNEYVRRMPLKFAGTYFDTPGPFSSSNLSNETAYRIPEGQPAAGKIQPGFSLFGQREYTKRVRAIFAGHGRKQPWLVMHATHGLVVPCSGFLDSYLDGVDYTTPASRDFMHAWQLPHMRVLDVPHLYGLPIGWAGQHNPWEGCPGGNADRCMGGHCMLHDIWGVRGIGSSGGDLKEILGPEETRFLPYWNNRGYLSLEGGPDVSEVRASLWHLPSKRKVLMVIANYRREKVRVKAQLHAANLGLTLKNQPLPLRVTDFESGRPPWMEMDKIIIDLPPLGFHVFLFQPATE